MEMFGVYYERMSRLIWLRKVFVEVRMRLGQRVEFFVEGFDQGLYGFFIFLLIGLLVIFEQGSDMIRGFLDK